MNEDKSTRYRRLQRVASLCDGLSAGALLLLLVVSGASAALRDALGGSTPAAVFGFVVLIALAMELLHLPFAYYRGVTLERRYGLSSESVRRWLAGQAKGSALGLALGVAAAYAVWLLLQWNPARWWIAAAIGAAVALTALATVAPVLVLPIFYEFKPLQKADLRARLERLAARAGARVGGIFEWRLQDRTRKANAALAGLGRTRRIIVSDTLLDEHSDAEVEVIVAHELAHHVHGDMWTSLAFESARVAGGLFVADRALAWSAGWLGLAGKADLAALPVVALAGGAVSVALMPVAHALSRRHERRADRYALRLTGDAPSFISAMKRLGAQNLAEERPTRLVEVLFYSHPPMTKRIAMAEAFARKAS